MLAMIYKLGQSAERSWRRLRGFEWLAKVVEGVKFSDGIEVKMETPSNRRINPAGSPPDQLAYTRFDKSSGPKGRTDNPSLGK
jgi:hypothetical protein